MANQLMRFDPFSELVRFDPFRSMDELFRDFPLRSSNFGGMDVEPRIRMDITESENAYNVKAEIPGVNKDDIRVQVDGKQVTISAEVKRESEDKQGESIIRSERFRGQQYRSFSLLSDIDDAEVTAEYADGVLNLTLPKKATTSAKRIEIR